MLITLSRRAAICQSVTEVSWPVWLPWELQATDLICLILIIILYTVISVGIDACRHFSNPRLESTKAEL